MSSVDAPVRGPSNNAEDIDPADFVRSIRLLSEKRDREDTERYKRLQEEVEKGRAERAARVECARSAISPEQANSANSTHDLSSLRSARTFCTPRPSTPSASSTPIMDSSTAQPGPPSPTKDIPEFKGFGSARNSTSSSTSRPVQAPDRRTQPSPSATSLARSGTLSWQRRPASRGGSRPASMVSQDSSTHTRNSSVEQAEPSRDQIVASLGSRDPSWFKQTADRGVGSAAYRKSADTGEYGASSRRGLPGLSRETSTEQPERRNSPAPSESVKSESRPASVRDGGVSSSRLSTTTSTPTPTKPDLKALLAADEPQQQASPMSDHESAASGDQTGVGRTLSMSSSQARLAHATERPSSPTKGMGGFVQSAMMKRSDSVSKRWSAQPGSTLSRQNSRASVRSGYGGLQGSYSMPKLEPTPSSREASTEPTSRPSSSSSNLTSLTLTQGREDDDGFVKPALPHHSRSKSVASTYTTNAEEDATSPPSSPSKRFSPNKSSWIESALTRPDSPKPNAPKNAQPSWMANIAKAKAERASADSTPRASTPRHADIHTPRSGSPTKVAPFGQGLLKRSDSRDLAPTPRSSTPPFMRKESPSLGEKPTHPPSETSPQPLGKAVKHEARSETPAEKDINGEFQRQPAAEPAKPTSARPMAEPQETPQPPKEIKQEPIKSPPVSKVKPETPPKPPTDFRSTLRSRAPPAAKQQDTPEFLSKFSNLRKAQTEKFVAPDVFKDNITRGKTDLTKTGGPVKTARRDELRDSLLAKKEDWKKAKEEGRELPGQVHERKTSGTPVTPSKPEALAKRDLLGRSDNSRENSSPEKAKQATPEALARHKSLKEKPKVELPPAKQTSTPDPEQAKFEHLSKQTSAPAEMEHKRPTENSKLASRFNPGLAGILARGPPLMTKGSNAPSRSESPAMPERSMTAPQTASSEPSAGDPLQDMRKGRAKGPKKRKQGGAAAESPAIEQQPPEPQPRLDPEVAAPKPRAPAGSAASVMMASMRDSPKLQQTPGEPNELKTSIQSPAAVPKSVEPLAATPRNDKPLFSGGLSSIKTSAPIPKVDDNKENADDVLPSVKSAASFWGRQSSHEKTEAPPQIQLPSKKDEDAALRSAGLLSSSRPSSRNGLGISIEKANGRVSTPPASAGIPPRPTKSSRVVSGQLQEASPNKGPTDLPGQPRTEVERLLMRTFGSVPTSGASLTLDTCAAIESARQQPQESARTLRKMIQEVLPNASLRPLPPQEEYTLFDDLTYVCTHSSANGSGAKTVQVFAWSGSSANAAAKEQALTAAKRLAREQSAQIHTTSRGHEQPSLLQALGGIVITRRGSKEGAPKQYILCGRKHLGHITFDEVDFNVQSLCSGYVYLVSYPVTLQQTKLYLWKGSACSTEELSAARLAAMDLSETGEIIEVDDGAEFASFLKIFGRGTMKSNMPKLSEMWRQKALAPERFEVRLFRVQQPEQKVGLFSSMFIRRPSWNSLSPSRSPSRDGQEVKVEIQHISPFMQADLEAEGLYMVDAYSEVYVLIGPLFASQSESVRNTLLGQMLLFAADYISATAGERPSLAKGYVLFGGVPRDVKMLFRHWDEERGLWGTAGLMAGSQAHAGSVVRLAPLEDVAKAVCHG